MDGYSKYPWRRELYMKRLRQAGLCADCSGDESEETAPNKCVLWRCWFTNFCINCFCIN